MRFPEREAAAAIKNAVEAKPDKGRKVETTNLFNEVFAIMAERFAARDEHRSDLDKHGEADAVGGRRRGVDNAKSSTGFTDIQDAVAAQLLARLRDDFTAVSEPSIALVMEIITTPGHESAKEAIELAKKKAEGHSDVILPAVETWIKEWYTSPKSAWLKGVGKS